MQIASSRRAIAIALAAWMGIVTTVFGLGSSAAASPPRRILTGWIPYYSMNTALPDAVANGDLIKEVMPFWFTLKSESKITDLYTPANPNVPMMVPLATMRDSGFTVIPTITDGTDKLALATLLANASKRAQVVKTITDLVMTNNFDGIDLDFEGFAFVDGTSTWSTTRPNWVAFVQELSTSLHLQGKLLSITTPVLFDPTTGKKGYTVYDWASIAPSIDRLRIMTYDYSTSSPGPIGPLPWVEQTVQYAISVVPASKVFIGVAGYGRDWVTKVNGVCPSIYANAIKVGGGAATFVMRDAVRLAASYGATPTYNQGSGEVTFAYQKVYNGLSSNGLATTCTASRTAWYQDSRGYAARAQLVAKYRLGGITAWTLGMEDTTASDAVRQVAQSIAPDVVLSTLTSTPKEATYGAPMMIKGAFQLPDNQPIAGLPVRLEMLSSTDSLWNEVFQTTTESDGTFSIPLLLSKDASLRLASDSSWDQLASQSAVLSVLIDRRISSAPPASAVAGTPFSISGVVQPHQPGVAVTLERFTKGAWQKLDGGAMTDGSGGFTISTIENTPGVVRFRLTAKGDANLQAGQSPTFTVIIY
ncbi:MAG TPA: glycosyl hydrolase family 18 protein [Candidatus Nanopelagicaceae bacterium]